MINEHSQTRVAHLNEIFHSVVGIRVGFSLIPKVTFSLHCAESVYQFSQTERRDLTSDTNSDQIRALSPYHLILLI